MAETTKIEWADSTFNAWIGCTKVGPGCDNCYAAVSTPSRALGVVWGPKADRRRTSEANWKLPTRWQRNAAAFQAKHGRRQRVFCSSLSDVFDNDVPRAWRAQLFKLIRDTPDLDWLLLTKRISNVAMMVMEAKTIAFLAGEGHHSELPENVWLGITVVDQQEADRDIPKLLAVPARVRFLSIEPMLSAIDLRLEARNDIARWDGRGRDLPLRRIDWVIAGGESGLRARPVHPAWIGSLRDQCAANGVPFLFKQWGEWGPDFDGAATCTNCGSTKFDAVTSRGDCGRCGSESWEPAEKPLDGMRRIGKKAAGRLLDGVMHDGFPKIPMPGKDQASNELGVEHHE